MRKINIVVHRIQTLTDEETLNEDGLHFRADWIVELFRTADVDLTLSDGIAIDYDPGTDPVQNHKFFLEKLQELPDHRQSGHLLIGNLQPNNNLNINGELIDLTERALATVYRTNHRIEKFRDAALTEIAAHEIGHLLNLIHDKNEQGYKSIMLSFTDRGDPTAGNISSAWSAVVEEAQARTQLGEPAFLNMPTGGGHPPLFPLSREARAFLVTASVEDITPWASPYRSLQERVCDSARHGKSRSPK